MNSEVISATVPSGRRRILASSITPSLQSLDAQYSTQLFKDTARFSIGIKNIMDEDPPSLGANVRPGYDNLMHNVLGRTVYMSLTQSF